MRMALGLVALAALMMAGSAAGIVTARGDATPTASNATIRIKVVATEFKFAFSRRSVPVGSTVIFTVVNKGKISHDLKIGGKKTPTLNPAKSATLKVKFTKKGRYAYLCTVLGHAKLGMKGSFAVGVTPITTTTSTTTQTTTTTTTTTPTTTTDDTGPSTTITVNMIEYRFDLSQTTVPSGQVTFVITNKGQEVHNFDISGVRRGALLSPGQTETWTIGLPPKSYVYICDVPFHLERGMTGTLTVS
jgi:plastocyanin